MQSKFIASLATLCLTLCADCHSVNTESSFASDAADFDIAVFARNLLKCSGLDSVSATGRSKCQPRVMLIVELPVSNCVPFLEMLNKSSLPLDLSVACCKRRRAAGSSGAQRQLCISSVCDGAVMRLQLKMCSTNAFCGQT